MIYPNPFDERLTIEVQKEVNSIKVFGMDGKLFYENLEKTKGILTIDTHDFPSGAYYVVLESALGRSSQKIIKF